MRTEDLELKVARLQKRNILLQPQLERYKEAINVQADGAVSLTNLLDKSSHNCSKQPE